MEIWSRTDDYEPPTPFIQTVQASPGDCWKITFSDSAGNQVGNTWEGHVISRSTAGLMLFLALLTACRASHTAPSSFGVVHADSRVTAEAGARLLDEVAPFVHAHLPGANTAPIEIWFVDTIRDDHPFPGFKTGGWAHGNQIVIGPSEESDLAPTMVHECVHVMLGSGWDPLPLALEEGLAYWFEGAWSQRAHVEYRVVSAGVIASGWEVIYWWNEPPIPLVTLTLQQNMGSFQGLGLGLGLDSLRLLEADNSDTEEFAFPLSDVEIAVAQRLGIALCGAIVERRGIEWLYEACEDAAEADQRVVPAAELLEAAGVADGADIWAWAVDTLMGEPEVRHVAVLAAQEGADALAEAICWRWRLARPDEDGDEVLRRLSAAVSVGLGGPEGVGHDRRVPLSSVPEFQAAFRDALARHLAETAADTAGN